MACPFCRSTRLIHGCKTLNRGDSSRVLLSEAYRCESCNNFFEPRWASNETLSSYKDYPPVTLGAVKLRIREEFSAVPFRLLGTVGDIIDGAVCQRHMFDALEAQASRYY